MPLQQIRLFKTVRGHNTRTRTMHVCAYCEHKIPAKKAQQCVNCKSVFYCGKACQTNAWKGHRKACRAAVAGPAAAGFSRNFERSVRGALDARQARRIFVDELRAHFEARRFNRVLELQPEALLVAEALRDDLDYEDPSAVARHVNIAGVYAVLGTTLRTLGDYHRSLEMYTEAKTAVDRVGAEMQECKYPFYHNYAHVLLDLRRDEEALAVLTQLEEATVEATGETRLTALAGMAAYFVKQGDFEKAIGYFPRMLEITVAAGDKEQTTRLLNDFAYAMMMAGYAPRAYKIYGECLHFSRETESLLLQVRAVAGLASCMWTRLLAPEIVGEEAQLALEGLGTHLFDARSLLQDPDVRLHELVGRVLLLTAFQQYLVGEHESAQLHVKELLSLMSVNARERCSSCWQARDRAHPLMTCGQCRVVRFCNGECQREGSEGRDRTNTHHIVAHRYVCKMLRAGRLGQEADAEPAASLDDAVDAFLQRMTAGALSPVAPAV